jgi:hypothetical protein
MKLLEALKTRWIVWVWNRTPTCAEMSRLASLSLDRPPSLKVRFKMWLHYLICIWCERYYKHLKFLHRAAPHFAEQLETDSNPGLSMEAKQRIKSHLQAEPNR